TIDVSALKHEAKADATDARQLAAAADTRHVQDNSTDSKSSGDDVVRLVSADGRGRPVDVSLPKVAGEPAAKDADKSSAPTKVETATVLEARRYLGFTPDSNATSLANAAKADPTWTSALQAVQNADLSGLADTVKEVNTLKLQMNPENLGNMVASLKLKGEELSVEVRVDSIEAYRHLSNDHDEIVKALQDQGFTIDKVTVQLNATERTDTGADRDMARQGQAQREEQGNQSNRNNNGRGDDQPGWTSGRDSQDNASGDNGEPGRAGNIYL
ncbi:MAG: flagellar hook-length control protein FliK, partial [Alphaproteobacteria bacterium]